MFKKFLVALIVLFFIYFVIVTPGQAADFTQNLFEITFRFFTVMAAALTEFARELVR